MLRLLLVPQLAAPIGARGRSLDVVHLPQPIGGIVNRVPRVVTVHDLLFRRRPQDYSSTIWRHYLRPMFDWQIRQAQVVLTVSEDVRYQVIRTYGIPSERVRTVHLGVDASFGVPRTATGLETVRSRYHLPESFVLFVGALIRRKNIPRLVDAFREALRQLSANNIVLVVLGRSLPGIAGAEEALTALDVLRKDHLVLHIPGVTEDDLPALYRLARALILPSLDEGFGLPVAEAMACGTAVITSNVPALAEVAGGAAHLVSPQSVASIADGISTVLRDGDYRHLLAQRGLERARQLTWENTAAGTQAAYRIALRGRQATA